MTIELEIKDIYADTVNLRAWQPTNEEVDLRINLGIGVNNEVGINRFSFLHTTPEALLKRASKGQESEGFLLVESRTLVIQWYDWDLLVQHLKAIVTKCQDNFFEASCERLTRYFHWEYEDYL